jgi:arylsulfatase A-like enzyme
VVRLRVHSGAAAARARSPIRVNGTDKAPNETTVQVQPGWSTAEFKIPAGQLRSGENDLLFIAGGAGGVAVEWLQVGGAAPAEGTSVTGFYDKSATSLTLPDGGGVAYYVTVPEKATLTADLADGNCTVDVSAVGDDGTTASGALVGMGSGVDLGALAGKAARVSLVAKGCPQALLAKASLVVPGAAPTVARGDAPKHIVFFVMDSLRADRVKLFNPKARPEVPNLEKLAETSAVFTNFYVQGNESQVSHASLWTSLYPIKHRKLGEKQQLDAKWVTIDEVAKSAKLFTAGVSANGYIRPNFGFGNGWDKFTNHIAEAKGLRGEDVYQAGLAFLGDKKDPWFLYLGTIDTHVSWRAKEPWASKYDPGYTGRFAQTFSGADAGNAKNLNMTERERDHVRALYDSNVSYQDELVGQLVKKLTDDGMWDDTMLIITADHGDEQWEDGRVGHGASNRDMLIHVPLIIHYPKLLPAGTYGEGTESIDVTPTVADALGVAPNAEWQGQSLIGLTAGPRYATLAFNSQYEDKHAGRIGRWKVRTSGSGSSAVYDVWGAPDEMKEAEGQGAEIGGRLVSDALWMLRQWNLEWKKATWGNPANVTPAFAESMGE